MLWMIPITTQAESKLSGIATLTREIAGIAEISWSHCANNSRVLQVGFATRLQSPFFWVRNETLNWNWSFNLAANCSSLLLLSFSADSSLLSLGFCLLQLSLSVNCSHISLCKLSGLLGSLLQCCDHLCTSLFLLLAAAWVLLRGFRLDFGLGLRFLEGALEIKNKFCL